MPIEVTLFRKDGGGILSKVIRLVNGEVVPDGAACAMVRGYAERRPLNGLVGFARLLDRFSPQECLALGALLDSLPDRVPIVTKREVVPGSGAVARTAQNIRYRKDRRAVVLIDFDSKGMPACVEERIEALGGVWKALVLICPELANAAHVIRRSTSSGLSNAESGEVYPGSAGLHIYVEVEDGADADRFLRTLHDRAWCLGLGWYRIGKAGQLLERSIVDRIVGTGERLVFEGGPQIEPPLQQDAASRKAKYHVGGRVDTSSACPSLTPSEQQAKTKLLDADAQRVEPERKVKRAAYLKKETEELLTKHPEMTPHEAREVVEKRCDGVLTPDMVLEFDDETLAGTTVADVLADPEAFVDETLADPLEGVEYGSCKAKILLNDLGVPVIHSFAHGGTMYRLLYDARTIRERLKATPDKVNTLIALLLVSDVDGVEEELLLKEVKVATGASLGALRAKLAEARDEQEQQRKAAARKRRRIARNDQRVVMVRPPADAPLTEEMAKINAAITSVPLELQLRRNLYGDAVKLRFQKVPHTHAFGTKDKDEPPAKQWTIAVLKEHGLTEELEKYIDYINKDGDSVRPPLSLVQPYMNRDDQALHTLVAIATQPIVLADGEILGRKSGFDPDRGIQFMVPDWVEAILPRRADCTERTVGRAMRFLTDEWLCDVEGSYAVKCINIALGLTMLERSLIPDRPVFFETAGRRGTGKTTLIKMIIKALTGLMPIASAWSMNEDERRKAILSQFMLGVPYFLWDNIPRGFLLSCPHVERSCTIEMYADRKLGVSEIVMTAASTIHIFTGNNIAPRDDLASRSLRANLETNRSDPENRPFKHPDPLHWTDCHRADILEAMYIILLGNPALGLPRNADMLTRFKPWYRLVGTAVEHAAAAASTLRPPPAPAPTAKLSDPAEGFFAREFAKMDTADEGDSMLGTVLVELNEWAPKLPGNYGKPNGKATFTAAELAKITHTLSTSWDRLIEALKLLLYPNAKPDLVINPISLGRRLEKQLGNPVRVGKDKTMVLKSEAADNSGKAPNVYWVETIVHQTNGG
jgi:hypothetical protein